MTDTKSKEQIKTGNQKPTLKEEWKATPIGVKLIFFLTLIPCLASFEAITIWICVVAIIIFIVRGVRPRHHAKIESSQKIKKIHNERENLLFDVLIGLVVSSIILAIGESVAAKVIGIGIVVGVILYMRDKRKIKPVLDVQTKNVFSKEEESYVDETTEKAHISKQCPHCKTLISAELRAGGLFCHVCGNKLENEKTTQADTPRETTTNGDIKISFSSLGTLLLIGGLIAGVYFLVFFDTSVEVPTTEIFGETIGGGRVNNLGLMNDRQNGINLGFGAFVVGLVLRYVEENKKKNNG